MAPPCSTAIGFIGDGDDVMMWDETKLVLFCFFLSVGQLPVSPPPPLVFKFRISFIFCVMCLFFISNDDVIMNARETSALCCCSSLRRVECTGSHYIFWLLIAITSLRFPPSKRRRTAGSASERVIGSVKISFLSATSSSAVFLASTMWFPADEGDLVGDDIISSFFFTLVCCCGCEQKDCFH